MSQKYSTRLNLFLNEVLKGLKVKLKLSAMPIRESPAAKRNRVPIGDALQNYLKKDVVKGENTRLLEIASGCGTHAMYFSKLFPHIHWQPSDFQDETVDSIRCHIESVHVRIIVLVKELLLFDEFFFFGIFA